jgi:toxin ParE1/3/4
MNSSGNVPGLLREPPFPATPEAVADLIEIWKYTAKATTPEIADRIVARIEAECGKLAEMPGMGHFREELLDQRFKFWSIFSYLIVYRCDIAPIQVVNVIHGARDLAAFFENKFH